MIKRINSAAEAIAKACGTAEIGLICGSGLGNYANTLKELKSLPYEKIPGFPQATVAGHAGQWCTGLVGNKRVAAMNGRFHYYEGHSMEDLTFPIRVMKALGVTTLIVTNAAGGVNKSFRPGDLMVIEDFINLSGSNPLRGENLEAYGPRFPDMSFATDPALQTIAHNAATAREMALQKGIYAMMAGPSFETPAEIRMIRALGGDAVGMSTVPEIIVARHMGMRVLGISCISNMAAGILPQPLTHQEVLETGRQVQDRFQALMDGIISAC